jgi:hypothetical protein
MSVFMSIAAITIPTADKGAIEPTAIAQADIVRK